jgi:hypothetical protein
MKASPETVPWNLAHRQILIWLSVSLEKKKAEVKLEEQEAVSNFPQKLKITKFSKLWIWPRVMIFASSLKSPDSADPDYRPN